MSRRLVQSNEYIVYSLVTRYGPQSVASAAKRLNRSLQSVNRRVSIFVHHVILNLNLTKSKQNSNKQNRLDCLIRIENYDDEIHVARISYPLSLRITLDYVRGFREVRYPFLCKVTILRISLLDNEYLCTICDTRDLRRFNCHIWSAVHFFLTSTLEQPMIKSRNIVGKKLKCKKKNNNVIFC